MLYGCACPKVVFCVCGYGKSVGQGLEYLKTFYKSAEVFVCNIYFCFSVKNLKIMASYSSTGNSNWPQRVCRCGVGNCVVKVSQSTNNYGRHYYSCPRPLV